jgi:hypothetical protein
MSGELIDITIGEAYSLLLLSKSLGNIELEQALKN